MLAHQSEQPGTIADVLAKPSRRRRTLLAWPGPDTCLLMALFGRRRRGLVGEQGHLQSLAMVNHIGLPMLCSPPPSPCEVESEPEVSTQSTCRELLPTAHLLRKPCSFPVDALSLHSALPGIRRPSKIQVLRPTIPSNPRQNRLQDGNPASGRQPVATMVDIRNVESQHPAPTGQFPNPLTLLAQVHFWRCN